MRISRLSDSSIDYLYFPEPPKRNVDGWGAYTRYYKLDETQGLKLGHNTRYTVTDLAMYSILRRVFPKYGIQIPKIYGLAVVAKCQRVKSWHDSPNGLLFGYIVEHITYVPKYDNADETLCEKVERIARANGLNAWDVGSPNTTTTPKNYLIDVNSIRPGTAKMYEEVNALKEKITSAFQLIASNEKA